MRKIRTASFFIRSSGADAELSEERRPIGGMTARRGMPKLRHLIRRNAFMQGYGSAPTPDPDDDSEHAPLTPRGMAAPPPADARRVDLDARRPATIRIEGNVIATVNARPAAGPQRTPAEHRLPRVPMAGKRLQTLVLAQGLLLNAFVLLLVFGWSSPLPGRRYLLGAFAIGGIVLAVLVHFALRHTRRSADGSGRPVVRRPAAGNGFDKLAVRALPAALFSVWIALGVYALALPPSANAFQETRTVAAPAPRAATMPARPRPSESGSGQESSAPQAPKPSWPHW